ncbi:ATPase/histidine kinase/DNA gyrase B/HSP90 domain protein [Candidatus Nitrosopumilus salaria BD31]|uniref:ATPase/histidine kinase/DNA gyrase B/HSP90 domain protein n=1 Tax=Candidatus Nitrosopumilus salarius BD31 TaxID=859350 RepID=I3D0E0_9ARCH|nr:HAMP domain-containing sensor histidine kinase [Candidatus Nitrosopumilus salaria]EIJ65183.1 ATPase/histidine kinase/DNA gyrase B/HSP90 domain protein [Candidatus Nitrosopumilus salaria BD31]
MNVKQKIILIVSVQIALIIGSFTFNVYLESEWLEFGQSINRAGLNRFLTSETHLQVQNLIIQKNFDEIPQSLEKLKNNLLVIKDGGTIENVPLKPLPEELQKDWNKVYADYLIFEKDISSLSDVDPQKISNFQISVDESSNNLIESSDHFVFKITIFLEKLHTMLIKLQIVLLFTNTLVHLLMIYLIFLILNRDAEEKIQLERFAIIGKIGATIIHDLRNSLTVIKGSIDILKLQKNNTEDKFKEKQFQKIDDSIRKIKYLTSDILDYTRITKLNKEEFIFSEIVQKSLDEVDVPNQIIITLPLNDYKINADKIKLQTVISNLIKNSIDAIGDKGTIIMDLKKNINFFIFSITDSGNSSLMNTSKIFTPLYTTKQEGTGLGLASCKRIMKEHGGEITVSTNPTKFTLFIPRK